MWQTALKKFIQEQPSVSIEHQKDARVINNHGTTTSLSLHLHDSAERDPPVSRKQHAIPRFYIKVSDNKQSFQL